MRSSPPVSQRAAVSPPPVAPRQVSLAGVMLCVMIGPFVNILDYNVVNVSLPKMMSGLATDVLTIRWVVTSALISTAVIMPAIGWLGRTLGNKNLYIAGLAVFTSASTLCSLASSVNVLIALRVLQGVGAGVLMPMSFVLMMEVYPLEKRGMGTALWGLGASLGSVLGLPLGGYFADAVNWRAVFCVNLLPGALGVLCTLVLVPPSRREQRGPFDGWGFCTLAVALVSLLVALSQGQHQGWDSAFILTCFAVFGVALVLFLLREARADTPLVDLRLYTNVRYLGGTCLALAMGLLFNGSTFITVLFAQLLLDLSVQNTALALLPGSIAMVLTTPLVGWMADRTDARLPMVLGLVVYTACCYLMLLADLRIGRLFIIWVYTLRGIGLGFLYPPVFSVSTSGFDPPRARAASSLLNLCVTLGGAFSISLLTTLIERRQVFHATRFAEEQVWTSVGTQHALTQFAHLARSSGMDGTSVSLYAHSLLQGMINREALVHALNDGFSTILVVVLGCIGVVLLTIRTTRR